MLNRKYIQLEQVAALLNFSVAREQKQITIVDNNNIASYTQFGDYDTLFGNVMDALHWLTEPSTKVSDHDN